ncbi:hypothetical protein E4U14_004281 [Claviceps sp. LM454 group G7]|nr:hypothetical protein E4U14_004281 [Claviceps sp. LM454 group G7]
MFEQAGDAVVTVPSSASLAIHLRLWRRGVLRSLCPLSARESTGQRHRLSMLCLIWSAVSCLKNIRRVRIQAKMQGASTFGNLPCSSGNLVTHRTVGNYGVVGFRS